MPTHLPYFYNPLPASRLPNPDTPLFIFCAGMDGSGVLLRNQLLSLSAVFEIRCLRIPSENRMDWEALTEAVVMLIKTEADRQKLYLCGESFGGSLALRVATYLPQRFEGVVLINPALSFGDRPWMVWGGQMVQWLPAAAYPLSALGLLPFLTALERLTEGDRQFFLQTIRTVPQATAWWRLSMLARFTAASLPLHRLTATVLMIASGADRLLPSITDTQSLAQRLPRSQIYILPDSGHACLLEQDLNLAQILQAQGLL